MKYSFLLIALFSIVAADKWALFVSGNNGYYNYCITSTICRGYDILHRAGVPEDHMEYLGFNDVFDSSSNLSLVRSSLTRARVPVLITLLSADLILTTLTRWCLLSCSCLSSLETRRPPPS